MIPLPEAFSAELASHGTERSATVELAICKSNATQGNVSVLRSWAKLKKAILVILICRIF